VRRYWNRLLPEYLFTWTAFFVTLMWALLVHFSDQLLNQSGDYLERFIVVFSLHLFVYLSLFVATQLYINRISPAYVSVTLLITICLVALGRGYLFDYWLYSWEIVEKLRIGFRMRSSLLNTAVSFVIAVVVIANTRRHQMIAGQLLRERARLENSQLVESEQIEEFHESLVRSITNDLKLRVDLMLDKSAQEVLPLLHDLINKVVQPLSRDLSLEKQLWTPDFIAIPKLSFNWSSLLARSFNPSKINYISIPLLLTIIVTPTILIQNSPTEALIGLGLTNIVAIFVGYLFREIFTRRPGNIFQYLLVIFLTGLSMGITSTYLTWDNDSRFALFIPGILFYVISAILLALINGAEEQRTIDELELRLTVDQLLWSISRVRERQRQNYRNLSRNLHDHVQAQFSSSYLEFEKSIAQGSNSKERLSKMIGGLYTSIDGLVNRHMGVEAIDIVIEKIQENWINIARISLKSDPVILKSIEKDALCSTSIIDVIPELVFNGIKHGKATEIDLKLELIDDWKVRLSVIDNGSFEKVESAIGLGTKILNESCISWTRDRSNAQTVTVTDFAFRPAT
jgi:signal transduction histidine kinase